MFFKLYSSNSSNSASGNVAKWLLRLTRMVLCLQPSNPFGGAGSSPAVVDSFAFALFILTHTWNCYPHVADRSANDALGRVSFCSIETMCHTAPLKGVDQ